MILDALRFHWWFDSVMYNTWYILKKYAIRTIIVQRLRKHRKETRHRRDVSKSPRGITRLSRYWLRYLPRQFKFLSLHNPIDITRPIWYNITRMANTLAHEIADFYATNANKPWRHLSSFITTFPWRTDIVSRPQLLASSLEGNTDNIGDREVFFASITVNLSYVPSICISHVSTLALRRGSRPRRERALWRLAQIRDISIPPLHWNPSSFLDRESCP